MSEDIYDMDAADRELADTILKTNIVVMCGIWVLKPDYRKFLSDPIRSRFRKLFHIPDKSLIHGNDKQGHQAVPERVSDRE